MSNVQIPEYISIRFAALEVGDFRYWTAIKIAPPHSAPSKTKAGVKKAMLLAAKAAPTALHKAAPSHANAAVRRPHRAE